ncbi:unnamed protein product, partial [Symbiodinium pilosum]
MSAVNPEYVALGEVGDISQMVMGAGDDAAAREIATKLQEALAALEPEDHGALLNRHAIPHLKQKLPSLDDDAEDEAYFRPRMEWSGATNNQGNKGRPSTRKAAVTVNSHMDLGEDIGEIGTNRRSTSSLYGPMHSWLP